MIAVDTNILIYAPRIPPSRAGDTVHFLPGGRPGGMGGPMAVHP